LTKPRPFWDTQPVPKIKDYGKLEVINLFVNLQSGPIDAVKTVE
jgi:hypothetical protein